MVRDFSYHPLMSKSEISIIRDAECVTRDGTVLRADVYHNPDIDPQPVLVCRTPYNKLCLAIRNTLLTSLTAATRLLCKTCADVTHLMVNIGGCGAISTRRSTSKMATTLSSGLPSCRSPMVGSALGDTRTRRGRYG